MTDILRPGTLPDRIVESLRVSPKAMGSLATSFGDTPLKRIKLAIASLIEREYIEQTGDVYSIVGVKKKYIGQVATPRLHNVFATVLTGYSLKTLGLNSLPQYQVTPSGVSVLEEHQ